MSALGGVPSQPAAEPTHARDACAINRVRELREDRLMTREELADRAGLSLRTVWSVESGKACRLPTKRKILAALGLALENHREVFPHG